MFMKNKPTHNISIDSIGYTKENHCIYRAAT